MFCVSADKLDHDLTIHSGRCPHPFGDCRPPSPRLIIRSDPCRQVLLFVLLALICFLGGLTLISSFPFSADLTVTIDGFLCLAVAVLCDPMFSICLYAPSFPSLVFICLLSVLIDIPLYLFPGRFPRVVQYRRLTGSCT